MADQIAADITLLQNIIFLLINSIVFQYKYH